MSIVLSVLICTIEKRKHLYEMLRLELEKQIKDNGLTGQIEILPKCDKGRAQGGMAIGTKRNWLYDKAKGLWSMSLDDDDWIDSEYLTLTLNALKENPDCVNMNGMMNTDGFNQRRFEHSIRYHHYFERNKVYYRPPGHINAIRSSIAKKFEFPGIDFGEDADWSMKLIQSGLLQKEAQIKKVLYHYRYSTKK